MSSENGKTVFEEAAAERELEELRLAIEETRAPPAARQRGVRRVPQGIRRDAPRRGARLPHTGGTAAAGSRTVRAARAETGCPRTAGSTLRARAGAGTRRTGDAADAGRPIALDEFAHDEAFAGRAAQVDPGGPGSRAPLAGPARCASRRHCRRGSARGVSLVARTLPGRRGPSRCRRRAAPSGRPGARTACGSDIRNRNTAASRGHDDPPRLDAGDRRRRAGGRKGSRGRNEDSAERLADRDPRRRRRRGEGFDRGKGSGSVRTGGPAGDTDLHRESREEAQARRFLPIPSWSPSTRCRGSCCPPPCRCRCCRPP